jgi:hypothetical protein
VVVFLFTSLLFLGCGGGGGTGGSSAPVSDASPALKEIGYIVDSPIQGVMYSSDKGDIGTTDKDGLFNYTSGAVVTFKLATLVLGQVSTFNADKFLTIQDLVGVDRNQTTDAKVLKIARLLQSLDDDNNVSNGITISQAMKDLITQYIADNELTTEESKIENIALTDIEYFVVYIASKTFLSESEVIAHLDSELQTIINADSIAQSTLYSFKKDENNSIIIVKNSFDDLMVTTIKDAKYSSSKILMAGDTNVFEIEYMADGVILKYNAENEYVYTDGTTLLVPRIPAEYIGVWQEETYTINIDVAYIYDDRVDVYSFNTDTFACSKSNELTSVEFTSLLQSSIDTNLYIKANTSNLQAFETYCGSYTPLPTATVSRSIDLNKFESIIDKTIGSSVMGALTDLFGGTIAGTIATKVYDFGVSKAKLIQDTSRDIMEMSEKVTRYVTGTPSTSNDTTAYDNLQVKVSTNQISETKNDISNFEDNTNLQSNNTFRDDSFQYAQEDENSNLQTTKVISYDENASKVEEIPNYDENGTIVSVTTRTNFDTSGGYTQTVQIVTTSETNTSADTNISTEVHTCNSDVGGNYSYSVSEKFIGYYLNGLEESITFNANGTGHVIRNTTSVGSYNKDIASWGLVSFGSTNFLVFVPSDKINETPNCEIVHFDEYTGTIRLDYGALYLIKQ